MTAIKNTFVGYSDLTYEQMTENINNRVKLEVPELSELSPNDPIVRSRNVIFGLFEILQYYLQNAASETFITHTNELKNAVAIARQYDYRLHGAGAATSNITFTFDSNLASELTIDEGTEVQTTNGVRFFTVQDLVIAIGESVGSVDVRQAIDVTGEVLGVTTADSGQKHAFSRFDVVDSSVEVTINSIVWTSQETLAFSTSTNKHFVGSINADGYLELVFGDGANGEIPPSGHNIVVAYKTTSGSGGNDVQSNTINTVVDTITVPNNVGYSITNAEKASGGFDNIIISEIRFKLPLFVRTLERAVTEKDFEYVVALANGVAKGGVDFECGRVIDVFIAPTGGGVPTNQLLSDTQTYIDDRKILGRLVTVKAAGTISLGLEITLNVNPSYSNTTVKNNVKAALLTFLSIENQDIGGEVQLSDIYEIVEGTIGVLNSNVKKMKAVPYARPLESTTNILNWVRELQSNSTQTIKWEIVFTSSSVFQLFKSKSFIGNFAVGAEVLLDEIKFTITGTYSISDQYEFVTYNQFGTLVLDEPSYVFSSDSDIFIEPIGGIV